MSVKFKPAVKAALTAAFFAPIVASAGTPAATLYGGGATLPQIAYVGESWIVCPAGGTDSAGVACTPGAQVAPNLERLTVSADAGSLFGQYTIYRVPPTSSGETHFPTISYCAIGSGGGRKVFYGASGFVASQACGDYTTSSKNGFSGANAEPNFAASDAPLSGSEYTSFRTNKAATRTEPVQIPEIAGGIAVVFANSDVTSTFNLTESQVCQIWKGTISNWNQINTSYPSKAIKLVYRSDDSGTSFNFSNHLSKVCPTAIPTTVSGFSTQSTFVNTYPSATPPTGAIGASGNGAIVTAVQANDGSIGYAEVEDAVCSQHAGRQQDPLHHGLDPAGYRGGQNDHPGVTFKKWDPTLLGNRFNVPTGGFLTDQVITGNDANGRPTLASITTATGTAPTQAAASSWLLRTRSPPPRPRPTPRPAVPTRTRSPITSTRPTR